MADVMTDGPRLLGSWKRIGSADRHAILAALPVERRQQFEELLAEVQAERESDLRFSSYSSWLRPIVEAAFAADDAQTGTLKPTVRDALRRAHERLAPENAAAHSSANVLVLARRTFANWVARL